MALNAPAPKFIRQRIIEVVTHPALPFVQTWYALGQFAGDGYETGDGLAFGNEDNFIIVAEKG